MALELQVFSSAGKMRSLHAGKQVKFPTPWHYFIFCAAADMFFFLCVGVWLQAEEFLQRQQQNIKLQKEEKDEDKMLRVVNQHSTGEMSLQVKT